MSNLTQSELKKIAQLSASKIENAIDGKNFFQEPFKHLFIDNFFDIDIANRCLDMFPPLTETNWDFANDADIEVKYRTKWQSEFDIPEGIIDVVRILNSALFLKAMTVKFNIEKIVPDPYFTGGGLNVTKRGGLLDVHVDGNYHDATGLNRRLNVLFYLNKNWQPSWGGEFGLYDSKGEVCVKAIEPIFNRLVIFDSHDRSFHGLPKPLNFPSDESRKSILLYYYTKEPRPQNQITVEAPHSALWKKRNLKDKHGNKTRDFY